MKTPLNFGWKFVSGFRDEYLKRLPSGSVSVDIPHAPLVEPVSYFNEQSYQGLWTYEKDFDAPGFDPKRQAAFLTFEGVMLKVHPFLNGVDLGERVSGWVPVRYDIASSLKERGNRLLVVVDSREDSEVPPFGKAVDYLTFAGIYRPVRLDLVPLAHIGSFHAAARMDGRLRIEAEAVGPAEGASLSFSLFEGGELIKRFSEKETTIDHPDLWSVSEPNLYTLTATLVSPYGKDERSIRIGFRDASFDKKGFFLNGKKTKLIGLNRHQNYPYVGPALPAGAQRDDAEILKLKLGTNVVRTSHYPQSEAFLDRCDELGLMVIDEVPGWQYVGKDKAWRDNYYYFLRAMVEKERDHPSLIAYGIRIDESADEDELYQKANDYVHETDPSRATLGVRNFKGSSILEDVYAYNDFSCCGREHGIDNPKTWRTKGHATLVSEHNGHMYPTKQYSGSERRLEQALRHARVIDDAFKFGDLSGVIGWCAFDYNTHQDFGSGDHICHHGVYDIFRAPKAAAYVYASQNSPTPVMWVANPPVTGDNDEALLKPLVVFTNCDYVELFRGAEFVEAFRPDEKGYPHMPHPPIFIDDFIGRTFKEGDIPPKAAAKIKKALNLVGQTGMAHLGVKNLLPYIPTILRRRLSMERLVALYYKYMSGWGEKAVIWTVRGYRDHQPVIEKRFGPSVRFSYRYDASSQDLCNGDTYDVSRVTIKFVDEFGTTLHYCSRVISFETKGPIEIIGPASVALLGGDVSVYVRSKKTDRREEARLIIKTDLGDYPIDFTVE
ncbi:MAG: glycoside hydrolase family 2 protein [Bacilli bacterium]|jgi:beta-galactosidase|nr:glycoside hydrolase family 2 protein [Bacilli bacterium]